ncbi:MAG: hypothetical protein HYU52_02190 [Acidobacteria bacterium]|nr:hypothetical protein [Acidobacteriota bacterium]
MYRSILIAALALLASAPTFAFDTPRSPAPAEPESAAGSSAEGVESQLFMRGVEVDLTPETATIRLATLINGRGTASGPLKLELWATLRPPLVGDTVQARVVASANVPFVLKPSETSSGYSTGPLSFNPPAQGTFYLTVALLESPPGTNEFLYADLFTLPGARRFGPAIVVSGLPRGLFQRIGTGGAVDDFFVTNIGNAPGNVQLSQNGDFFSMSPTSFTLAAGVRERIKLVAGSRSEGFYKGEAIVNVNGQPVYAVPIRLLAANPPSGEARLRALIPRVDISGAPNTSPRGSVTFSNTGSATIKGFPISDSPWLVPDDGLITIAPGGTASVGFTSRRELRHDDQLPGISGMLSFVYLLGTSGGTAKSTLEATSTSAAGVIVTDTSQPTTTAGAIPPLSQGEVAVVIPGVGHVVGSVGEFVSDLSIVNGVLGATVGDMRLYYSSTSASKSGPNTTLAPTEAMNLADVITGYFGETGQVGTIQLRTKSLGSLSTSANVFNKSNPDGTYGTAIPTFRTDRAVSPGQKLVITGLRQNATAHTNIYLQEMSGTGQAVAQIDFYNSAGAKIGSVTPPAISPFGLGSVFAAVPAGAVAAVVTPASGRLVAYATPVDDLSGDTWAVADWSRQFQLNGTERSIIPVAGAVAGANNSNFRTDLSITCTGGGQGSIRLVYYPSGSGPITRSLSLGPNQSSELEDVVPTFFNVAGTSVGWISVEPQDGSFVVTSRTYTKTEGNPATFGTGVATVPPALGLELGESRTFGGLEDSTTATVTSKQGATFRTNIGLIEVSGQAATARVSVYFATGTQLAAGGATAVKDFALTPNGYLALNGIVRQIVGDSRDSEFPDLRGVSVKVEVVSGSGTIVPYATATDNGTNDTVLRLE